MPTTREERIEMARAIKRSKIEVFDDEHYNLVKTKLQRDALLRYIYQDRGVEVDYEDLSEFTDDQYTDEAIEQLPSSLLD